MCGIAGYYFPNGAIHDDLKIMAQAMAHRGPDAEGIHVHGAFGLAHRRLSILDLSTAAHQPMTSACGRYVMVYNGEVYNFRELKAELKLSTRTTSDTEVILEAFARIGPAMVHKLNGMFAIALLDKEKNELYLFRDRLGIKPLYIYHQHGLFAFASELKSLTALSPRLNFTVDSKAVAHFLHRGYIPQSLSIYKEVSKFPTGHWGVYDGNELRLERYWSSAEKVTDRVISDEVEAKAKLDELLTASVKRRLISDVPFGTFLSGGIDSSVVTALAQKVSDAPIKTFSIGFDNAKHNESHFAQQVADHLGTEHHTYTVTEKDALALASEIVPQYDEPFADSSAIPTMLVSKLARQQVTMTLSGDGGDELFMGYGAYIWADRLQSPLFKYFHNQISGLLKFGNDRQQRVARLLRYERATALQSHIFSQEQGMFSATELSTLLKNLDTDGLDLKEEAPEKRQLTNSESQAFFDLNHYLKDDLLVKVDRATMRYGLETRVPLLDHTVVEFALNLSPELKMYNGNAKYLLKQLLYEHVPKELFNRPKWGFSIPLSEWLRGDLAFLIDEYLNESTVTTTGIVHWPTVKELVKHFRNGKDHLYNRVWLLILLHQWFQLEQQRNQRP
jgi:asparagine synthase (glutamine-hydrolysing)